jgi:hypothetical protein
MNKQQFRRLCSQVASRYHWSKRSYSPPEMKIKIILEKFGLVEGKDFVHNARVRYSKRISYYPDFLIWNKFIIEYSPAVWHKLYWNTEEKFKVRKKRLEKLGYIVFVIEKEEEIEERMKRILAKVMKSNVDSLEKIQGSTDSKMS